MDHGFVAEDADAYQQSPAQVQREVRPVVALVHASFAETWSNLARRVRFLEDAVPHQAAAVRAWLADRSVGRFRWLVRSSSTPASLVEELTAADAG